MQYEFTGIFDNEVRIKLWGYNIETVMAEKLETILTQGIFSTRPRDYYDIYILCTTQKYDITVFKEALNATAIHRGSAEKISDTASILKNIFDSEELQDAWTKYQNKFLYAKDISYKEIMEILERLLV